MSATTGFVRVAGAEQPVFLYRTTDASKTWTATPLLPEPPGFFRSADVLYWTGPVRAFGSMLLVAVERQSTPGQTNFVYRSTDDGATWSYLAKVPAAGSPAFVTATRWVQLLVPGQSQETTDAGATWHPSLSDYGQAAPVAPLVVFGDAQTGYATVRGSIQRTIDGTAHWTYIRTPGTS